MKALMDLFKAPSADEMAARELAEARRDLLIAQTGLDWARASVDYNTQRIRRLEVRQQTLVQNTTNHATIVGIN